MPPPPPPFAGSAQQPHVSCQPFFVLLTGALLPAEIMALNLSILRRRQTGGVVCL
jgi:hypothetical protein